jgi:hypothetical protein
MYLASSQPARNQVHLAAKSLGSYTSSPRPDDVRSHPPKVRSSERLFARSVGRRLEAYRRPSRAAVALARAAFRHCDIEARRRQVSLYGPECEYEGRGKLTSERVRPAGQGQLSEKAANSHCRPAAEVAGTTPKRSLGLALCRSATVETSTIPRFTWRSRPMD